MIHLIARDRLRTIGEAIEPGALSGRDCSTRELRDWIVAHAGAPDDSVAFLILAVLYGRIPRPDLITAFTRRWRLDGLETLLDHHLRASRTMRCGSALPVRVESGVVVDVTDTSRSRFTSGIQRVARETLSRWITAREFTLVAWNLRGDVLATLSAQEEERAVLRSTPGSHSAVRELIVPYHATFVLPEISVQSERTARLLSIARFSGSRSVAIGFDCIPVTMAETAGAGMPGAFSKYLSTLARFDVVVPISSAAGHEYRGWKRMLTGAGLAGPEIHEIALPFVASDSTRVTVDETRRQLGLADTRVVLAVGSREPRKNHLNLLHAAELAWRAGHEFALVLVGGNAWDTELFDEFVARLRRKGRRILTLHGVDDDVVWDLYKMACFTVFCSLNEGFGLPIVESLSSGTPVITSDFGSMRELGEGRGALLVDPYDVDQMAGAITSLLSDPRRVTELAALTVHLPAISWDSYADELWALTAR